MPQRPIRTLGTPASVSTIAPTGERSGFGARSARKRPIAIAIGVAMRSANSAVIAVPKMKSRAPYWSLTAFHVLPVRNPRPNFSTAGCGLVDDLPDDHPEGQDVRSVAPPLRPNSVQSPQRARFSRAPARSNRSVMSALVITRLVGRTSVPARAIVSTVTDPSVSSCHRRGAFYVSAGVRCVEPARNSRGGAHAADRDTRKRCLGVQPNLPSRCATVWTALRPPVQLWA